jgi:hypothetical protein
MRTTKVSNKRRNAPILINLTQQVLVATLELPKVAFVKTYKNVALSSFDR